MGRVHYAWVILGAVMAMNAVSSGIRLSFAAYVDPLVEQYGWSRGAYPLPTPSSFWLPSR